MCTGLEIAALVGAGASAAGAVSSYEGARKSRNMQKDAANNAALAAKASDTRATQDANARIAMRRRALATNSLATGGGEGMAATGRTTLGGG